MTTLVVAAAVIERDDAFLMTRRLQGTHLAGAWEFPGGKCEPGESLAECLIREMHEELDVVCRVGEEVFVVTHPYEDRVVELHFFACEIDGAPAARLGQEMQWVPRGQLRTLEFPPADDALIERLTYAR